MQSYIVRLLLGLTLVIGSAPQPARPAAPDSCVSGTLSTNTTWLLTGSPYVVCAAGVTVAAGATLTVEPGVLVQFQAGVASKLNVAGALNALGTITQTITFNGVSASAGSWAGLSAVGTAITPAQVSLSYVTLDYGGRAGSSNGEVFADQAAVTITHSLIRNSAGNGVYISINARLDAHFDQFTNNAQNAIQLNQPSGSLLSTYLAASGNGANGVFVQGTADISGQQRWAAPGIPYIVNAPVHTGPGDVLTIDPGSTLEFTANGWLDVRGGLTALGTPSQPITLTGQTKTAGSWIGLVLNGAGITQLDYVTIEYGGNAIGGANIHVANGRLIVHHSLIRYSSTDGVRFDTNSGGSILNSQIVSNTLYGVFNSTPQKPVQATNNWWGDPSGPHSDLAACPSSLGSKVTAGVFFQPVLTSTASAPFPLSSAPIITLTPRRWFAPADGLSKIYFDITVRDGNGLPLPGRTVLLSTSLGHATDGGITDQNGKTLAYLTSSSVGDADVTGALTLIGAGCADYLAPESQVTFTPPVDVTDLFPNAPSSYFDGDINISPLPVTVGVPTVVSAKLTNPLTVPITVDVSFGFVQSSIGLAFGPIHDFVGQVIPANSSLTLAATVVPPVSGHYCVVVTYAITGLGSGLALPSQGGSGRLPKNWDALPAPTGSPSKGHALDKTRNALDILSGLLGNLFDTNHLTAQSAIVDRGIQWQLSTAEQIDGALHGDPPRQDYKQLDRPHKLQLPPVQAGGGVTPARAAALNALADALAEANADGAAAVTALDRSGGASEAGDLQWSSLQAAAVLDYNQLMGTALITAATRIDDVLNVAAGEGVTSVVISTADVISLQQHLAAGFSAQEISDAHAVGLTDAEIEAIRQQILAAKPEDLAGDLVPKMQALRDEFLALSDVLLHPVAFNPGFSVSGGAGLQLPADTPPNTQGAGGGPAAPASGNTMAQVFNSVTTLQLGNPLTHTALIDVSPRRIDLPADWAVEVSPAQVTLAPGQQTTVTVTVIPGSPVPQGSMPRVAVEGYAGSQLLGGVVIDIVVPNYVSFDGKLHLYLPVLRR